MGLAIVTIALCAGLVALPAHAQTGSTGRQLSVGDTVTGTLDAENFTQVYTLAASEGDTISIEVTTETEALAPVIMITDQRGDVVIQDVDTASATSAEITDLTIPANGTYYILVMRGTGADGDASGDFTIRVTGVQQVGGQSVTLDQGGLSFDLGWNAAVNFNLEVRDPVGGTVHAFNLGAPSGGTLDADVNADCDAAISDNPAETIAWPTGDVPAGSYEIIIYYLDACAVGGPQVFNLSTSANNEEAQTLSGTLNPGQRYLARLILNSDASWELQNGGVNAGLDVTLFGNEIANAEPVAVGSTLTGLITNNEPAQAYSFDATSGTIININLNAQSGSLDTYLVLLGPDNQPLVSNDDADDTTTDSAIARNLAVDGTYTILATRYGLTIGGTEGEFTLSVTTGTQTASGTPAPGETPVTGTTDTTDLTATLTNGSIEVALTWLTNADIQLQVRDPNGATVYDDTPTIPSGGTLEATGNVGCETTSTTPISYIFWPQNRLLPGTYEVEVWYQNTCEDNTPVSFVLSVNVQDQTIINTTPTAISVGARYMITFTVAQDGTVTVGPGDFFNMANANSLNYQAVTDTAQPINYGGQVTGSITERERFELYAFQGQAGDTISVSMQATGGTLDPAVYLISPEGIQLDYNDDVTPGENPNSLIDGTTLATTGNYIIIATHYGLHVGGTTGTYQLTLVQE
jgi:hypothetical protein